MTLDPANESKEIILKNEQLWSKIRDLVTSVNKTSDDLMKNIHKLNLIHRMKSVQTRSLFWSVFSCTQTEYGVHLRIHSGVQIQGNRDQKNHCNLTL